MRLRRQFDQIPALAGRKAGIVEEAAGAGLRKAEQRHGDALRRRGRRRARGRPSTSARNSSSEEPVASMILASNSVDGQRGRPSAESRFDLLKAVESRPARLARPEADSE